MRQTLKRNNLTCCLFFILLLFVSCQETIYHSYQPVEYTGWDKSDTLIFTLSTPISTQKSLEYEYQIGIRHKDSYKYRDIWLTINHDTVHLYLADSIGRWKGNGISELRQITFPYNPSRLKDDSIKEVQITHIMQDNPLPGIHDIGISIQNRN